MYALEIIALCIECTMVLQANNACTLDVKHVKVYFAITSEACFEEASIS